ncbi:MAG: S24 family peptidase [Marinomonas sp.]
MTLSDRVKQKRIELGLTQTQLANLVGISQQSLQKIEDGKTQNPRKIVALSKALECEPEWLESGQYTELKESIPYYKSERSKPLQPNQIQARPIITHDQAANWPKLNIDVEQTKWMHTEYSESDKSFWLKVVGDHMTSPSGLSVPEGYFIFIETSLSPQNGDLVIAKMLQNNEITFKKFVIDAGRVYLKPLNPLYHAIEATKDIQVIGVVKEARTLLKV